MVDKIIEIVVVGVVQILFVVVTVVVGIKIILSFRDILKFIRRR